MKSDRILRAPFQVYTKPLKPIGLETPGPESLDNLISKYPIDLKKKKKNLWFMDWVWEV